MDFTVKAGDPEKLRSACVIVGISAPRRLSPAAERLDKTSRGQLRELLKRGDIDPECGKTTLIHQPKGRIQAARILVVGCGKDQKLPPKSFITIASAAAKAVQASGATEAVSFLTELEVEDRMAVYAARDRIYLAALSRRAELYRHVEEVVREHHRARGEDPRTVLQILQLDHALCPREGGEHSIRESFDFDAAAAHRALSAMDLPPEETFRGGRQQLEIRHPGGVGDILRVADGGSWAAGTILGAAPTAKTEGSEVLFVALA